MAANIDDGPISVEAFERSHSALVGSIENAVRRGLEASRADGGPREGDDAWQGPSPEKEAEGGDGCAPVFATHVYQAAALDRFQAATVLLECEELSAEMRRRLRVLLALSMVLLACIAANLACIVAGLIGMAL